MTTNPLRADELRERFGKQHEKWLIGTDDDAEAAQEWVMENLPSLLALLTPPPSLANSTCDFCDGSGEAMGLGGMEPCHKCQTRSVPPSLASVVAEIDALHSDWRNSDTSAQLHHDPEEEFDGEAAEEAAEECMKCWSDLADKLVMNWDQLRTALTISGTGWRDISTAPKKPAAGSNYWGPKILINTEHHGHRMTFIGRYHHGVHKRFMDTADGSCVTAGDEGDLWMPLPQPKTGEAS